MVDKLVIVLKFLGMFLSLDLSSRYLIPCINCYGLVSGCIMALFKQLVMFSSIESKVFNKELGTWSLFLAISTFVLSEGFLSLHLLKSRPIPVALSPRIVLLPVSAIQLLYYNPSSPKRLYFFFRGRLLKIHL